MAQLGKHSPHVKTTFLCDPHHFDLAARAANWLLSRPEEQDGILAYGDSGELVFYVKRNKAGISVMQANPTS